MVEVSYERLWKLLEEKGMDIARFQEAAHLTDSDVEKLKNNENVNSTVLANILIALECNIEDVMEILSITFPEGFNK